MVSEASLPSSVQSTITSSPPAYNSVSNEAFPFLVHVTCLMSLCLLLPPLVTLAGLTPDTGGLCSVKLTALFQNAGVTWS